MQTADWSHLTEQLSSIYYWTRCVFLGSARHQRTGLSDCLWRQQSADFPLVWAQHQHKHKSG